MRQPFAQTEQSLHAAATEARRYATLYRRYAQKALADKLGALLSGIAVGLVVVLLGSVAALLLFFFLAHLIGELTGSLWIGFATLSALSLVMLWVAYAKRHAWIALPLVRLVDKVLEADKEPLSPDELRDQLRQSEGLIREELSAVRNRTTATQTRGQRIASLVGQCVTIYNGVRIGASLYRVASSLLMKRLR